MRRIAAVTFDLWDTLIQEAPGNADKVAAPRKLGQETDGIGEIIPHYFSFGGILQTARYSVDAAHRLSPAGADA